MPFIVNEEHVASGIVERVNLNINLFGEQSAGAISIDRAGYRGDNPSVVSAQALDDLISDRDPTSTAAAAFTGIDQQEQVAAASYKRMGPKKVNLSDIQRSLNLGPTASPEATWLAYGNAIGEQLFKNYVLTSTAALAGAIQSEADNVFTAAAGEKLTLPNLYRGYNRFGDRDSELTTIICHSQAATDLRVQTYTDNVDGVANAAAAGVMITEDGKRLIKVDSPFLRFNSDPGVTDLIKYITLVLRPGAALLETPGEVIRYNAVVGNQNLEDAMQGQYDMKTWIAGFSWDVATGGSSATDAALATAANWAKARQDVKSSAGVAIITE